jgi:hypothetical protein
MLHRRPITSRTALAELADKATVKKLCEYSDSCPLYNNVNLNSSEALTPDYKNAFCENSGYLRGRPTVICRYRFLEAKANNSSAADIIRVLDHSL